MDESFMVVPEEELNNTYLLYADESDAQLANQTITSNMNLPQDSQTTGWDMVAQIMGGDYIGFWCIKKPDVSNPTLLEGVVIEIEAEYEPSWFEETE